MGPVTRLILLPLILAVATSTVGNTTDLESAVAGDPADESPQSKSEADPQFHFYGRINRGLLVYDDGAVTNGYFPVDNDNQASKFGIRFQHSLDPDLTLGGVFEMSLKLYSTQYVNQVDRFNFTWDQVSLRRAEFILDNNSLGKLWFGQGSTASDGSSEVDLSGTAVIGYASVSDIANAQFLRFADGSLSDLQIGSAYTDMDGLGRKLRIRYDTPQFNGFSLGVSAGTEILPHRVDGLLLDAAINYSGDVFSDVKVAGTLAYSQSDANGTHTFNGSVSALHVPSGLNLTFSSGTRLGGNDDEYFVYGKLGHQKLYFDMGKTAFSLDAYFGNAIATNQSTSVSYGIQAVQFVDDWNAQLYLGGRTYIYDDPNAVYKDGYAIMAGALFEF